MPVDIAGLIERIEKEDPELEKLGQFVTKKQVGMVVKGFADFKKGKVSLCPFCEIEMRHYEMKCDKCFYSLGTIRYDGKTFPLLPVENDMIERGSPLVTTSRESSDEYVGYYHNCGWAIADAEKNGRRKSRREIIRDSILSFVAKKYLNAIRSAMCNTKYKMQCFGHLDEESLKSRYSRLTKKLHEQGLIYYYP